MTLDTLERSCAYCERLAQREAGNFFHAFQVLPRPQRRAMCRLYAFMHVTDDLLPTNRARRVSRQLAAEAMAYRPPRGTSWRTWPSVSLPALHHTIERFAIPVQYLEDVIDGVEMDLGPVRFADFDGLYRYCYRVASAVGLACIHIWGFRDDAARVPAEHAGIALQLTNILRDLPEDLARDRVYLPGDDLERFGCDVEGLCRGPVEQNTRRSCTCGSSGAAYGTITRLPRERERRFLPSAWTGGVSA